MPRLDTLAGHVSDALSATLSAETELARLRGRIEGSAPLGDQWLSAEDLHRCLSDVSFAAASAANVLAGEMERIERKRRAVESASKLTMEAARA